MQRAYFLSTTLKNAFHLKQKTNNFKPIPAQTRAPIKILIELARYVRW